MRSAILLPSLVTAACVAFAPHAAPQCNSTPPVLSSGAGPGTFTLPGDAGSTGTSSAGTGLAGSTRGATSGATSGSAAQPRERAVRGVGTARGLSDRGVAGRARGGATTTPTATLTGGFDASSWQVWWSRNRDAYLWDAQGRPGSGAVSAASGLLSGRGRSYRPEAERPSRGTIYTRIVPLLLEQLQADDTRVASAALIGLGNAVDADLGAPVEDTLLEHLGARDDRVRMAAAVGLGLVGSRSAGQELIELVTCSQHGHGLVGESMVPDRLRAVAALALALGDHAELIPRLMHAMDELPDSQRDLKAAIVVSLGNMPSAHSPQVRAWLAAKLVDRRLDPIIQSAVPTALARHGDPDMVPQWLALLDHRDTNRLVIQSLVLALGALADPRDDTALDALLDVAEDGKDPVARQFAWLSLARVATRPGLAETAPDAVARVAKVLRKQLDKPGRHTDRPYVALAAGLFGRQHGAHRGELLEHVLAAFDDVNDPDLRGALAVSLGLLGDRSVGRDLRAALDETTDEVFAGHLAVSLGLIGYREADAQLRELATRPGTRRDLRESAALGLRLLGDRRASGALAESMVATASLDDRDGLAQALGTLRDVSAVGALDELLSDGQLDASSRTAACAALGGLAEKTRLPWRAELAMDRNYVAAVADLGTLLDG